MDEQEKTELEVLDNEQLEAKGEEIQEEEVEVKEEIEEEAEEEKPEAEPEIQDDETLEEKKEPEKQELILGKFKTEEELQAYIAESIQVKADEKRSEIQEEEAIKKNEQEYQNRILQISKSVEEIDQAKAELEKLFNSGEITPAEYSKAIQKAEELRMQKAIEYGRLESSKHLIVKPKVQKENTLYYQKLEETIPELKQDTLVKKYTNKLKTEVFDNSGIKIEGSFDMYVKDYIIGLAKESEERGYKKALEEIELNKLKAKQKTIASKSTKQPEKKELTREQRLLNELID